MNIDIFKGLAKTIGGALKNIEIEKFQEELSNKLNDMEEKFTIDRFENDIVVCENRNTGEFIEIEKCKLPKEAREGMIVKEVNNKYVLDIEETEEVSNRIKEKMDNLWN